MALSAFRLRRTAAISSAALRRAISAVTSSPTFASIGATASPPPFGSQSAARRSLYPSVQSFSFRTSAPLADRRTNSGGVEDSKFGPDDILFEGCDYNHWLITMDFPKDPAPTPEEMVETYVQTLAKVVGSVEEAKKRMYACSTTTYHGFQAVMTEEMSEKFRGLPGVVFILPDSYIDPVNKEYGGDKYDNGVITPRPPPVQYNRQRPRNQYRNDRPNYNRPPPQGAVGTQQGPVQGDGGYYAPQQNYAQPGQGGRGGYGESRGRDFVPPGERRNFGQGEQGNYSYPSGRDGFQGERRDPQMSYQRDGNYVPQDQRNFSQVPGENSFANPPSYQGQRGGNFVPPEQRNYSQGQRGGNFVPPEQRNYSQGQWGGNFVPPEQRNYSQGPVSDNSYAGPSGYGDNSQVQGQGFDSGYRRQ